jgi:hypothetical protein
MEWYIKTLTGKTLTLHVEPSMTVGEAKKLIAKREGYLLDFNFCVFSLLLCFLCGCKANINKYIKGSLLDDNDSYLQAKNSKMRELSLITISKSRAPLTLSFAFLFLLLLCRK